MGKRIITVLFISLLISFVSVPAWAYFSAAEQVQNNINQSAPAFVPPAQAVETDPGQDPVSVTAAETQEITAALINVLGQEAFDNLRQNNPTGYEQLINAIADIGLDKAIEIGSYYANLFSPQDVINAITGAPENVAKILNIMNETGVDKFQDTVKQLVEEYGADKVKEVINSLGGVKFSETIQIDVALQDVFGENAIDQIRKNNPAEYEQLLKSIADIGIADFNKLVDWYRDLLGDAGFEATIGYIAQKPGTQLPVVAYIINTAKEMGGVDNYIKAADFILAGLSSDRSEALKLFKTAFGDDAIKAADYIKAVAIFSQSPELKKLMTEIGQRDFIKLVNWHRDIMGAADFKVTLNDIAKNPGALLPVVAHIANKAKEVGVDNYIDAANYILGKLSPNKSEALAKFKQIFSNDAVKGADAIGAIAKGIKQFGKNSPQVIKLLQDYKIIPATQTQDIIGALTSLLGQEALNNLRQNNPEGYNQLVRAIAALGLENFNAVVGEYIDIYGGDDAAKKAVVDFIAWAPAATAQILNTIKSVGTDKFIATLEAYRESLGDENLRDFISNAGHNGKANLAHDNGPIVSTKILADFAKIGAEKFKETVEAYKGLFTNEEISEYIRDKGQNAVRILKTIDSMGVENFKAALGSLQDVIGQGAVRDFIAKDPVRSLQLFQAIAKLGADGFENVVNSYAGVFDPATVAAYIKDNPYKSAQILNAISSIGAEKFQSVISELVQKAGKDKVNAFIGRDPVRSGYIISFVIARIGVDRYLKINPGLR